MIIINRQTEYELTKPCINYITSLTRVLNTIPGLTVDIYVNNIPTATYLTYREITQYVPSRSGPRNVKIYESNTNNLLLELKDFDIIMGQLLTYPLFGNKGNLKYIPIVDDINESVALNETKIRFYNLTSYNISFTLSNPKSPTISTTLDSGNGTKYTKVNPGEYTLKLDFSNQKSRIININFKSDRIYTVYIINSVSSDNPNYLQLNIPQIILVVDGNTLFTKCTYF